MAFRAGNFLGLITTAAALLLATGSGASSRKLYTGSWAVEISGGDVAADAMAARHGLVNHGQVGALEGVYHFALAEEVGEHMPERTAALAVEDEVVRAEQQEVFRRVKRASNGSGVEFSFPSDPMWDDQWSLYNSGQTNGPRGIDLNVVPAWIQGFTGRGVVVAVVDDGVQASHPDLSGNFDSTASHNFAEGGSDPTPPTPNDSHGTSCAGEIAMVANNDHCGAGVAHNCNLGGVRINLEALTDIIEASALNFQSDYIQVYSNSWGPSDLGFVVAGPGTLTQMVFQQGVKTGRNGLGSIWVFASGNGGQNGDSCAADGYASSIYTMAVGSADQEAGQAFYDEDCSGKMAVTYSFNSQTFSPFTYEQVLTTTTMSDCVDSFTGTSASAPLLSGVIGLVLQANSSLTWRDIQYLTAYTSDPTPLRPHGEWTTNGGGLLVSHQFGFGAVDAEAMVTRARHWITVPEQSTCTVTPSITSGTVLKGQPLVIPFSVTASNCEVVFVEHVVVEMTLTISVDTSDYNEYDYSDYYFDPDVVNHAGPRRGDIMIELQSPAGTNSVLLPHRRNDFVNEEGYSDWPFMSVHHWGENPRGPWRVNVSFDSGGASVAMSNLSVTVYGTRNIPQAVERIPSQCSPECARGCAAEGPQFCDACKNNRMPETLECVSSCPSDLCSVDGYCVVCSDQSGHLSLPAIVGFAVAGIVALVIFLGLVGLVCKRQRSPRREYVTIT